MSHWGFEPPETHLDLPLFFKGILFKKRSKWEQLCLHLDLICMPTKYLNDYLSYCVHKLSPFKFIQGRQSKLNMCNMNLIARESNNDCRPHTILAGYICLSNIIKIAQRYKGYGVHKFFTLKFFQGRQFKQI